MGNGLQGGDNAAVFVAEVFVETGGESEALQQLAGLSTEVFVDFKYQLSLLGKVFGGIEAYGTIKEERVVIRYEECQ